MQTLRSTPRISLHKLGEYLGASPRRRRRILADQKYPSPYAGLRYARARAAIVEQLVGAQADQRLVEAALLALSARDDGSRWQLQADLGCIEALLAWLDLRGSVGGPRPMRWSAGDSAPARLAVRGVEISVRPDLHVQGVDRRGRATLGVVTLYFSKHHPLGAQGGLHAATALHRWAQAVHRGPVSPQTCQVVDVFARAVWAAPAHQQRRWAGLEVACEEIAQRWAQLPAPSSAMLAA